jgi:hypothetical protein
MVGMESTTHTLSRADRLTIRLIRYLTSRLARRFSEADRRVWWVHTPTFAPRERMWLPGQPVDGWPDNMPAGRIAVGFGGSHEEAIDGLPVLEISLTRPMYDLMADGIADSRRLQDEQLAALRAARS